jgi:uncharacterized phage-associated protein
VTTEIIRADAVADYFLANFDEDSGDNVTNLRLQKLLYYAQGFHLAMQGGPLFPESLLARNQGPMVQQVWRKHRHLGFSPIGCPEGYQEDSRSDGSRRRVVEQ